MLTLGRFRPAQGAIHAFCLFVAIRGLIDGPVPDGALYAMLNGNEMLILGFYICLLFGSLIAMTGEIIQLKIPMIETTPEGVGKLFTGILTEAAGCILMSANLVAFSVAFFVTPNISTARAVPFIFLGLGILGRFFQAVLDLYRIRVKYELH